VGFVGKGRIVKEERVESCGAHVLWYAVLFMDDVTNREREAGRSVNFSYAKAIKARWEKETCTKFNDAPVKYSVNGARRRKKPQGQDPRGTPDSRMMKTKVSNTDSVPSN
jgi:hypothetical protein